jgi:hypothetical protein
MDPDYKIVWNNNDSMVLNSILCAIEENNLNKYSQSTRTKYVEINNSFYFIKGFVQNIEELEIFNEYGYNEVEHFIQFEASPYKVLPMNLTLKYVNELDFIFLKYKKKHFVYPDIPKPVAIFQYSKKFENKYFKYLSKNIRCRAFGTPDYKKMFQNIVSDGICFFVYSYPFFPKRIASFKFDLSGQYKYSCEIEKTEDNFSKNIVTNFIKLYELGYLFKDFMHHGNALQTQNISTKGTFLDMDSIIKLDRIRNPDNLLIHNIWYLENELNGIKFNLNIGLNIINNLSCDLHKKKKLVELLIKTYEEK